MKIIKKSSSPILQRQGIWPFESLFEADWGRNKQMPLMAMPKVNMTANSKELKAVVEVPGCEAKDIEVHIEDDVLVIRAKKSSETKKKNVKQHYYYHESSHQEFSRALPLPTGLVPEKAKSKVKNGVLTVTVPKKSEKKASKKHTVKVT